MKGRRALRIAALAFAVLASALNAQAQITTGSVAGTVKDAQGGVIPGATVTLVNESQGTRFEPAVTSASGDFVFANVASGTYAIDIEMPSFKKLKRSGLVVSAGERVAVGVLTLEVGGTEEVVTVRGEAPLIQATTGDRSFTVTTEAVENLPIASRSFTALATLAPGVSGMTRIGGGGNDLRDDGRHFGGRHGIERRPDSSDECGIDCRSEGPDLELPGGVRPLERPSDYGGHQERHQSLPGIALRRRTQLRLEQQQQGEQTQLAIPSRFRKSGIGVTRLAAQSGSPAATTSCSFSTRRNSNRGPRETTSCGSGCPRRSNVRGIFRRRSTTTVTPIRISRIRI